MKVDDGCAYFLKIDDDLNDLTKQGDAQAIKLERSKDVATCSKAADFVKKKRDECNNGNDLDDSNHCGRNAWSNRSRSRGEGKAKLNFDDWMLRLNYFAEKETQSWKKQEKFLPIWASTGGYAKIGSSRGGFLMQCGAW